QGLRIGAPGCVGTIPAYRRQGIGLKLVQNATAILKQRGYDLSYIHYTGVGHWYARLGYQTILKWNAQGIME
ncbi:MAG: GNAT family N-acetyltransferase, partial [Clostridia bacterium]|nr:GNAT family N-acetyltransferase [Clostridia bacterium]